MAADKRLERARLETEKFLTRLTQMGVRILDVSSTSKQGDDVLATTVVHQSPHQSLQLVTDQD